MASSTTGSTSVSASHGTSSSSGQTSTSSSSVPPPVDAAVCDPCLGAKLGWAYNGGLVAYTSASSLAECGLYTYGRTPAGGGTTVFCSDTIGGCGAPSIAIEDVERALADPDVVAALSATPGLYGSDPRPCDGAVLDILEVGGDCPASGGGGCGLPGACRPVPMGVRRLASLVVAIDAQELAAPACKSVFP
jgi:hypothetical protein